MLTREWGRAQKPSTLDREPQATKEKQPSPGKNTPIYYI